MKTRRRGNKKQQPKSPPKINKKKQDVKILPKKVRLPTIIYNGPLHRPDCTGSEEDIIRMRAMLKQNRCLIHINQDSSRHVKWKFIYPEQLSALHDAAEQNHLTCVNFLLASKASVHLICNNMTPLQSCVMTMPEDSHDYEVHDKVVKTLLLHGSVPNVIWDPRASRSAMLRYAIGLKHNNIVNYLLDYGAVTEHMVVDGCGSEKSFPCKYSYRTPLTAAIQYLNYEGLKALYFRGASLYFDTHIDMIRCKQLHLTSVPHYLAYNIRHSRACEIKEKSAKSLQILKLYKEFGGNLWSTEIPAGFLTHRNILQLLQVFPVISKILGDYVQEMEVLMKTPRTLMSFCRQSILRQIGGTHFWSKVSHLPLPKEMIGYLVFHGVHDIPVDLDESDDFE